MASLNAIDGIPCTEGDQWQVTWPSVLEVSVATNGAVSMTCVSSPAATLTLSWTGSGSFFVYNALDDPSNGISPYRSCFAGVQPGPTYSCTVDVPTGSTIDISASPTVTAWGGACAGIGTIVNANFRGGSCRLLMDASKTASVTFTS